MNNDGLQDIVAMRLYAHEVYLVLATSEDQYADPVRFDRMQMFDSNGDLAGFSLEDVDDDGDLDINYWIEAEFMPIGFPYFFRQTLFNNLIPQ